MELTEADPLAPHGRDNNGDPIAPYGFRGDGVPKKLPGRPTTVMPLTPKKKEAKKTAKGETDYTEGIRGLFSIPLAGLALAGMKDPVYAVDSYVVSQSVDPFAEALNDLAQTQPMVAAALDKALMIGPYGMILGALVSPALQILTNHRKLPAGFMGTRAPEEIMVEMQAKADALAAAA